MIIGRRRRHWVWQPQQTCGINRHSDLTRGLKFLWNAAAPGYDAASGATDFSNTSMSAAPTRFGWGQEFAANGNLRVETRSAWDVLGEITVFALIVPSAVSADTTAFGKCDTNGSTVTPFDFGLSSAKIRLNRANATYRVWASGSNLAAAGVPIAIAASQGADISVAPSFYANGVLDTASPTSLYGGGASGAASSNSEPIRIGNRADLVTDFPGPVCMCALWDRVLTANEHFMLSSFPWRTYAPRIVRVPFNLPAGGAFKAAWARQRSQVIGAGVH